MSMAAPYAMPFTFLPCLHHHSPMGLWFHSYSHACEIHTHTKYKVLKLSPLIPNLFDFAHAFTTFLPFQRLFSQPYTSATAFSM